jgi:hypothetical protein
MEEEAGAYKKLLDDFLEALVPRAAGLFIC